jgi:hypothetical protein
MKNFKTIVAILAIAFVLSACGPNKTTQQERLDFVTAQSSVDREFMVDLIGSLKDTNEIVKIEAFEDQPIQINAKSFTVRVPIDLQAVFNSAAFRIDYGHLFPQTTNGWDAFIAVLTSAERIAGSPIPWLASAIVKTSGQGITINGNENAVSGTTTTRSQVSDSNNETDNSDNSNNSDNFAQEPGSEF